MADQERKDDAKDRDSDADNEAPSVEEKAELRRRAAALADAVPVEAEIKSSAELEEEAEDAEAAKRVAKALGLDDDEDGQEADAEAAKAEADKAAEAAPNRIARRREEALERRKKRKSEASAGANVESEDEPLPRDKNARAKELLKRRREQASAPRSIQLLPGEMVDDALARSASATGKWLRKNFSKLQWVILAALAGVGVFALYTSQTEKKAAAATDNLFAGVSSELGRVMAEDKRSDEEKEMDPTKVYKTAEERSEAALVGYRKTIAEHPGTVIADLAKLGEAGVLLDKHDWDGSLAAYTAVLSSKLAGMDVDVRGRATEGVGLAKEGKGDRDGALAAFKDVEGIDARGYKELGLYQQGRMLLAKGETDKAKDLLKQAHDKLLAESGGGSPPNSPPPFMYLQGVLEETLRQIDPTLVSKEPLSAGVPKGGSMSPDDRQKIQKMLDEAVKKKQPKEEH